VQRQPGGLRRTLSSSPTSRTGARGPDALPSGARRSALPGSPAPSKLAEVVLAAFGPCVLAALFGAGGCSKADAANPGGTPVVRATVPGGVRGLGRVDAHDPSAVKFAWSATGLVATVSGTKISANLQTEGAPSAFFQPVIDGKVGPRFEVPGGPPRTITLGDGLSPGDHVVELYRETEGMYGHSVFGGFVEGTLKGAPAPSGRLVEIIGDSISAGYGNLGNETHPPWDNKCGFSFETESAYQSYGAMVGRALDAEVSIVARSGWGMYRAGSGDLGGVLSSVYANALGTEAGSAWNFERKPDVVLVNLGTNDGSKGDPGSAYEDSYVAFLHTVRGHYPGAWIFLTLGPMTSPPLLAQMRAHIAKVATALGDAKVVAVELPTQDPTSTGCDYHPNVARDAAMASVLAPAIRAKLGW
jgi:lysophospholipase L1-like esterase